MIIQRTYTSRLFKLKARVGRFRTGLADNLQEKINNHVKRNDIQVDEENKSLPRKLH